MKRYQFIAAAALFITALMIFIAANDRRDRARLEMIETGKQLEEAREQVDAMRVRLAELEALLLNLRDMQQITSNAIPSRGGRQLTLTTMPLTTPSGYMAGRLDRALAGTALAGLGQAFYGAEKDNGINALVLAAICAHESGWGTSRLARDKNNLAGLGAYDCSPGKAMCFDSREECVFYLARLLRDKPGDSLAEIGIWYASDPYWAAKVAERMKIIAEAGE